MKSKLLFLLFIFISINSYSQTWIVEGNESTDFQYTIITQAQFERMLKANEQTNPYVVLNYVDTTQVLSAPSIINGVVPKINGYFYLTVKLLPKNEMAELFTTYVGTTLIYGNTETGTLTIAFSKLYVTGSISLEYERNEYIRKFNELISIVNSE